MITLKQMQYIQAVDQEGSFSQAAERCFVTQSTLSAGIKEAETILGQRIFDRTHKKPALTDFGAAILDQVSNILNRCESLHVTAQQYKKPMSAPIRLGVIPTIAPYMLPFILPDIAASFPDLDLHIHEDLSDRLVSQLDKGHLDVLILALPFDTPGAQQTPLLEEDFYLASLKGGKQTTIKLDQVQVDDLLLLADGHCLTDHALQACALQKPSQRRSYSASSLTTLIQMVAHGMGQTLLPEMVVKSASLPPEIAIQPFAKPRPKRTIGMVWRQGSPRAGDYQNLLQLIKDNFSPVTKS